MPIARLGTANMYDRTIGNIQRQQAELASQMEHVSAGRRVLRTSDDPVGAAQAERAMTRLQRIETDQRMLKAQTATIKYAESTLGNIYKGVQDFRTLLIQAGDGTYNQTQRDTLVEQLQHLREQLQTYVNRKDSNGLPLFRGLDTRANTPFPNGSNTPPVGVQSGQTNIGEYSITNALDGVAAFFSGKTGNGVMETSVAPRMMMHTGVVPAQPVTAPVIVQDRAGNASWSTVTVDAPDTAARLGNLVSTSGAKVKVVLEQVNGVKQWRISGETDDGLSVKPERTVPYNPSVPAPPAAQIPAQTLDVQGMKLTVNGNADLGDTFTIAPDDHRSTAWIDAGVVRNPDAAALLAQKDAADRAAQRAAGQPETGAEITVRIVRGTGGVLSYEITGETADGTTVREPYIYQENGGAAGFRTGRTISVQGMDVTISGEVREGDTFKIRPSRETSLFDVVDAAIREIRTGSDRVGQDGERLPEGRTNVGKLATGIARALSELDIALNRVSTVRGTAGSMLQLVDTIENTLDARADQVTEQRVSAQGYTEKELVAAYSRLNSQQTAVTAALQSYASIQKLSLFDYIR